MTAQSKKSYYITSQPQDITLHNSTSINRLLNTSGWQKRSPIYKRMLMI